MGESLPPLHLPHLPPPPLPPPPPSYLLLTNHGGGGHAHKIRRRRLDSAPVWLLPSTAGCWPTLPTNRNVGACLPTPQFSAFLPTNFQRILPLAVFAAARDATSENIDRLFQLWTQHTMAAPLPPQALWAMSRKPTQPPNAPLQQQ